MINTTRLVHAYRQAPWRRERQWLGAFLLGLLSLAMIGALYLDVTSQTGIVGRELQSLQREIIATRQKNADLQTRLSILLSTASMEERARNLGFRLAEAGEIHYLVVPGYARPSAVTLAATHPPVNAPGIPPEYTQSLFEWLFEYLRSPVNGIASGDLP